VNALLLAAGVVLILLTLADAFETMILPRRVGRRVKLTRYYYLGSWAAFVAVVRPLAPGERRENLLSVYGPLSLIFLFGIWAALLVVGFALVYHGLDFTVAGDARVANFGTDMYFSGTTFFTIGLGDVASRGLAGRTVTVLEGGTGFAFLALVIGYLPVLYQAFSRREVHISLLDARAGSPPTAAGLFRRYDLATRRHELDALMQSWERWAAEVLESHLSFPLLAYFRSQHDRQSWVAALCAVLDANAVLIALGYAPPGSTPQLAFAMARHAAVDLGQILGRREPPPAPDRLPPADLQRLRGAVGPAWPEGPAGDAVAAHLAQVRAGYEPYMARVAARLLMPLPPWLPAPDAEDDWETGL
jgi:hypothetical protein